MRHDFLFSASLLGLLVLGASPARAETPAQPAAQPSAVVTTTKDDPARAQVLFDQAVALANAGEYGAACKRLEQSLEAHDGLGTAFHLAGCWQKLGRTASAYAQFEKVALKAHDLGQTEREELARSKMEALIPKLSRLRIDLAEKLPAIEVFRDERPLAESDWGKPLAVDPGTHELRVTAPGKKPWATRVEVTEPATTMAVQVPPLVDLPKEEPPKAVVAPAPAPRVVNAPPAEPAAPPSNGNTQRTLAIVVGGIGVAALGAGVLEGAQYLHFNREAKSVCPAGYNCSSDEIARHGEAVDDARTARTWAYVGVGVGGAALVTATYLYFSAPKAPPGARQRATALAVAPLADGRGTWGGALNGNF